MSAKSPGAIVVIVANDFSALPVPVEFMRRKVGIQWQGCGTAPRFAPSQAGQQVCMNSSISPATLQTAVFKCSLSGPSVDQTRNHQNAVRTFLSSIRQIVRQPHY